MKRTHYLLRALALPLLFTLQATLTQAQIDKIVWPKGPMMVNASVTPSGELKIVPSKTSSANDFDYLKGKWTMHNTKLKKRLANNHDWFEFDSDDLNYGAIIKGVSNMDVYKSNLNGKHFEGLTLRLFNPETKLWSLYWIPNDTGIMDPPVVGSFEGNIGKFFCKDTWDGKPILVVFVWDKTDKNNPVWSQAFSADNGKTWEWNFTNTCHRVK